MDVSFDPLNPTEKAVLYGTPCVDYYRNGDKMNLGFEFTTKDVTIKFDGVPNIKKVIFNDPATIVYWSDNTKTVVKCWNEKFDKEKGLAMAITKKAFGNANKFHAIFKEYIQEEK